MSQIKEFFRELAEKYPENMTYPFNELIRIVGFDNAYNIAEAFGGISIYIPRLRGVFREPMDMQIAKEFNGDNYAQLAQKFKLCERSIRNIINKQR